MVVNRKQPAAPLQPISRSSSTQAVPTKRQQPPRNVTQNGVHDTDARSSNKLPAKPSKHKIKQRNRPKSLFDRFFLLSLSLFTFYAFYTCRPNPIFSRPNHNEPIDPNPLCRSLSAYHTHILQPYVIPSAKHGLAFANDISRPYIAATQDKLSPYAAPVVEVVNTVTPYAVRTANVAKDVWLGALVPFYKGTLKPYYVKAVLPRYRMYIKPRLAPLQAHASKYYTHYVSRPLHIQSTRLQRLIHAKQQQYIHPYWNRVRPYIVKSYYAVRAISFQAVDAYKGYLHPQLSRAWVQTRPILSVAWKHTKRFSVKTTEVGIVKLQYAVREIGGYRRAYVDPHVLKIWEKVAEGTERATPVEADVTTPVTKEAPAETVGSLPAESAQEHTAVDSAQSTKSIPVTVKPVVDSTTSSDPLPEDVPSVAPLDAKSTPPPQVEEMAEVTSSSVTSATPSVQDAAATDAPVPEVIPELIVEEALRQSDPVASSVSNPTHTPTPDSFGAAVRIPEGVANSLLDVDDVDDFLKEIGLEETDAVIAESPAEVATEASAIVNDKQQPTLSAEELEVIVAAKRAKIVERHDKWFERLEDAIKAESTELMKSLEDLRAEKLAELTEMSGKPNSDKGLVIDVQKEGERLIKGLEAYLRKGQGRDSAWKVASDAPKEEKEAKKVVAAAEKDKWATVLSKVESKFSERVIALQSRVHSWFVDVKQREIAEVQTASRKIKHLAESAQADLGMDYAWLEDVTYDDWQEYHDLVRLYEEFEQTAYALQNGTVLPPPVRPPPADPLVPALDMLHNDLQDVIMGFQVALGAVRGDAAKVFSLSTESAEDEDGFFVVKDGQIRKDDLRGVDLGGLGLTKEKEGVVGGVKAKVDDEVRILPIDPSSGDEDKKQGDLDASTIVIGKDKVQVEQALGSIPIEPAASKHEEL